MRCLLLVLLGLLVGGTGCEKPVAEERFPAGPLGISVVAVPLQVRLGEPLRLTVRCRRDKGVSGSFPTLEPVLTDWQAEPEADVQQWQLANGAMLEQRVWVVRQFSAGNFTIAAVEARGQQAGKDITVKSKPVEVTVESVLEKGQEKEIEKPAQVVALPQTPLWPWLVGGGALLLLLGGFVWNWLRRRRARGIPPPRSLPPAHLVALKALSLIREAPRDNAAEVEEMVEQTSAVIRRYVERRFGIQAPERTTEEFLLEAAASRVLPKEERDGLARFLFDCDKAKFAGWTPAPAHQEELLDSAEDFVRRTAPTREVGA